MEVRNIVAEKKFLCLKVMNYSGKVIVDYLLHKPSGHSPDNPFSLSHSLAG